MGEERRQFSREFKIEAVRLVTGEGRKVSEVARQLGIRPDRGEVRLNGEDVVGKAPSDICRRGVGRTFQVVKPFRRMSIADNVVVGAFVRTRTDADARALAARAIAAVGLAGDAHRLAGSISNLQLRLMELARALASKPQVLLLDETLAGLTASDAMLHAKIV